MVVCVTKPLAMQFFIFFYLILILLRYVPTAVIIYKFYIAFNRKPKDLIKPVMVKEVNSKLSSPKTSL